MKNKRNKVGDIWGLCVIRIARRKVRYLNRKVKI